MAPRLEKLQRLWLFRAEEASCFPPSFAGNGCEDMMDRDQFWRKVVDRKYGVYVVNGVQQ